MKGHSIAFKLIAEFVGTFLLVPLAVGSAVSGIVTNGTVGVAIGFGVVLAALAYALGPTSGCHVNPAVTLRSGCPRPGGQRGRPVRDHAVPGSRPRWFRAVAAGELRRGHR